MIKKVRDSIFRRGYGVDNSYINYKRYDLRSQSSKWMKLYNNEPIWLKNYKKMKHSGLASAVVNSISSSVLLNMETEVTGGERSDFVNKYYQKFLSQLKPALELTMVQGSVILKPFLYGRHDDKIGVEVVPATNFIPLEFNEIGELCKVVFIENLALGNVSYTRLETHSYDFKTGLYTIENKAYDGGFFNNLDNLGNSIPLTAISLWSKLKSYYKVPIEMKRPLFVYMKTPYTNLSSINSNLGLSIYSKIEKNLEDYDVINHGFLWEFESKKTKLFVSERLVEKPDFIGGERKNLKEEYSNGFLYEIVKSNPNDENGTVDQLIKVFSPDIQVDNYLKGMNKILREIETKAGLSFGDLSDANETAKTATQVLASKSERSTTVKDYQHKTVEQSLRNLVKVMFDYVDIYDLVEKRKHEEYKLEIEFSDGVVDEFYTRPPEKPTVIE